jgi:restriction system protein
MSRKKQGLADDLVTMFSKLPWWVGVLAAVISYLIFHRLSMPSGPVDMTHGNAGVSAGKMVWQSLASAAQYLVPFICLLGAVLSVIAQTKRRALVKSVSGVDPMAAIKKMTWAEFEILVGEVFRQKGFQVAEVGGGGADGGVDLRLSKGNERFLVQCKQWKAYTVGVTVVRELYGVVMAEGATGGYVITSGKFSEDAKAFAKGKEITLIEGLELTGLLDRAKQNLPTKVATTANAIESNPKCPKCSAGMVRRKASKGANAGNEFWGCSTYPTCKGTRSID